MKVPSNQLIRALEFAAKPVNDKAQLPSLTCVLFEPNPGGGIRLTGTNLQATCSTTCGGTIDQKYAAPRAKVLTFIRNIGQGVDIDVVFANNRINLEGAGGRASVPLIPAEEFPAGIEIPIERLKVDCLKLAEAITFCCLACEAGSSEPTTANFEVEVQEKAINAFGTDRKTLLFYRGGQVEGQDAFKFALGAAHKAIFCEMLNRGNAQIALTPSHLFIFSGDDTAIFRRPEVSFPDATQFLSRIKPGFRVDVDDLRQSLISCQALATSSALAAVKLKGENAMVPKLSIECETAAGNYSREISLGTVEGSIGVDISVDAQRSITAMGTFSGEVELGTVPGIAVAYVKGPKTAIISGLTGASK